MNVLEDVLAQVLVKHRESSAIAAVVHVVQRVLHVKVQRGVERAVHRYCLCDIEAWLRHLFLLDLGHGPDVGILLHVLGLVLA